MERPYPAWIRIAGAYGGVDVTISGRESMGWLRESLLEEFGHRHVFVRALVRACIGRSRLTGSPARLAPPPDSRSRECGVSVGVDRPEPHAVRSSTCATASQ